MKFTIDTLLRDFVTSLTDQTSAVIPALTLGDKFPVAFEFGKDGAIDESIGAPDTVEVALSSCVTPDRGTFTLSAPGGPITGEPITLPATTSAKALASAMAASWDGVSLSDLCVTGGNGFFRVEFQGDLSDTEIDAMTGDGAKLSPRSVVSVNQKEAGGGGQNAVQIISLDSVPLAYADDLTFDDGVFSGILNVDTVAANEAMREAGKGRVSRLLSVRVTDDEGNRTTYAKRPVIVDCTGIPMGPFGGVALPQYLTLAQGDNRYPQLGGDGLLDPDFFPPIIIVGLRQGTKAELDSAEPPLLPNEPSWETDTLRFRVGNKSFDEYGGNGNYVGIRPGDDMAAAYAAAKSLTPHGEPLSATNRAALVMLPGTYKLDAELEIDADFVDVIASGAGICVKILDNTINIPSTTVDVRVSGIDVSPLPFKMGRHRPGYRVHFCRGGDYSFGTGNTAAFPNPPPRMFYSCIGGNNSFGGMTEGGAAGVISGTFENCIAGNFSFAGGDDSSGGAIGNGARFLNCQAGTNSFGGGLSNSSGTHFNSVAGANSFGPRGNCDALCSCCTGGENSFGGGSGGNLFGRLFYTRLTVGTFKTPVATGRIRFCIDGNNDAITSLDPD